MQRLYPEPVRRSPFPLDEDGYYVYCGRSDDMIKVAGNDCVISPSMILDQTLTASGITGGPKTWLILTTTCAPLTNI